jgi:hypothetical protein
MPMYYIYNIQNIVGTSMYTFFDKVASNAIATIVTIPNDVLIVEFNVR